MNLSIVWKSYDIRGIYPIDLDEDFYYRFGRAIMFVFAPERVAVGRDARLSSPSLASALVRGIIEGGGDVVDVGICSTDMISFATGHYVDIDFGIMVTASHNPKEYNGMKICRKNAVPVNTKEYGDELVREMMREWNTVGSIGNIENRDIVADWVDHICSFIDLSNIKPLRVVADAGNGTAGIFFGQLAERLRIECIPMYFEPDGNFPNHHPSPIEPENMADLIKKVRETGADLWVAFDGDADRMYVCDETGVILSGSVMTAAIAEIMLREHSGATVVYNAACGDVVPETIARCGGKSVREKVGHVYIKQVMEHDESVCFGGEHSGHYYFRQNWNADSGAVAFAILLESLSLSWEKTSELRRRYEPYATIPETNFRVKSIADKLAELKQAYHDGEQSTFDGLTVRYPDWWFNVRPSSNEPLLRLNMEVKNRALLDEKLAEIRTILED